MISADTLYALALKAYPRAFLCENQEEILGTLAELNEAGKDRGRLRQALSLGYNGNRTRWLQGTGGSIARTLRQGIAWGALILVAREAGVGLHELFQGGFLPSSFLAVVGLTAGWLAVFALLVLGRRKSGLVLLGVVLAGYVADGITRSLAYGGHFSMGFTLHFFLPVTLPLLLTYVRPKARVRLSIPWALLLLIFASIVPALNPGPLVGLPSMAAWAIELGACLFIGIVVLLLSISDPRWAVATTLLVFVRLISELIHELNSIDGFAGYAGVLMLAIGLPAGCLLLSVWARRRTALRLTA